jgi:hypothetical protein
LRFADQETPSKGAELLNPDELPTPESQKAKTAGKSLFETIDTPKSKKRLKIADQETPSKDAELLNHDELPTPESQKAKTAGKSLFETIDTPKSKKRLKIADQEIPSKDAEFLNPDELPTPESKKSKTAGKSLFKTVGTPKSKKIADQETPGKNAGELKNRVPVGKKRGKPSRLRKHLSDSIRNEPVWIKDLDLNAVDKNVLLASKCLTSDHINAVNILGRQQFPEIFGLQSTHHAPVFSETHQHWTSRMPFKPVPEDEKSAQIHHNGRDHWVVTVRPHSTDIFFIDSLLHKNSINPSLEIQMAQIYGKTKKSIKVRKPKVQQQTNGSDCGVFAIAFLVEFCVNGLENIHRTSFDIAAMRYHLATCFESHVFKPFPKMPSRVSKRNEAKPNQPNVDKMPQQLPVQIDLLCPCGMPNVYDDMVGCDGSHCLYGWYHKCCVGLVSEPAVWTCQSCLNMK